MQMTVCSSPSAKYQLDHQQALSRGLKANGVDVVVSNNQGSGKTKHVSIWGWRRGKMLHAMGHQVLVLERGYLGDRFAYTSLAWNGLNGHGTFGTFEDDTRLAKLGVQMKPWKTGGDYVLLMGQVPGDASLNGRNMVPWYEQAAMLAQTAYEMPVRFRPHPKVMQRGDKRKPTHSVLSTASLEEDLAGAFVAVTWNSNSAVDAVMAGVPTVTMDKGSMAWDVTAHRIGDIARPNRDKWAKSLACKQWTLDEIESGAAVKPALEVMWRQPA